MKKMFPLQVYTLGDYYSTPGVRELCHRVKGPRYLAVKAIIEAADRLSAILPKDATIVPVPCSTYAFYTDDLAERIAKKLFGKEWKQHYSCCIDTRKQNPIYNMKKAGVKVTESDCLFFLCEEVPEGPIILVDNVVATGTTISAAMRLIGRRCCVACIGYDLPTFRKANEL